MGLEDKAGFYLDGHYHSLFTIKRWPQKTYPGIVHRLTALPFLDYQITVNLEPIPVREEITREEKAIDRLRGDYEEEGKYSMSVALKKKERKIDSLAQGFSFPFYVEYAIRVWDRTETGLHTKCAAIKNAVNQMNGAQVYETALPTTAKKLFFSTWPGWTGTSYRHRDLYAEDRYLADLLPFSSTFTAHLAEAEAIYDGTNGNLAGVRTFIGGTPQHAVLIGMTGAGKSFAMDDLLTQTQAGYRYLAVLVVNRRVADCRVAERGIMPPGEKDPQTGKIIPGRSDGYFVICGAPHGGRNHLSVQNNFNVLVFRQENS